MRKAILIGLFLLLGCGAARASITVVQSQEGPQTGVQFISNITNGDTLLVMFAQGTFGGSCPGTVKTNNTGVPTDNNSNTYVQAGSDQCDASVDSLEVLDSETDIQLTPRHSNAFVERHRNSYGFVAVRLMTADIPPCDVPS